MELNDQTVRELSLSEGALIYFIGIGGSSMSGLAEISLNRGYRVSGSDMSESSATLKLRQLGAAVNIGHVAENVDKSIDLVVYTVAISKTNPEYLRALELGIPVVERGVFLGYIAGHFEKTVAVAGVHGKTTTTSMIASVLLNAGMDPSAHIGGVLPGVGSSVITGGSSYFVTEACEYHRNFLHILPFAGIILNVEPEHLDYFKTFANMKEAFAAFAGNIPKNGYLILCADSRHALACAKKTCANLITYSVKRKKAPCVKNALGKKVFAHFYAKDPVLKALPADSPCDFKAGFTYTLIRNGSDVGTVNLRIPGIYNVLDSLAAAAAAWSLGCPDEMILKGMSEFTGAKRRFEVVGCTEKGAVVVSDYAHHPSEIKVTIEAAKQNTKGRVIAVFQPHTYSRALRFKRKFAKALKKADLVILTEIYAAREKDTGRISSADLEKLFLRKKLPVTLISNFDDIAEKVKKEAGENDIVLLLGAGTVNQISASLVVPSK